MRVRFRWVPVLAPGVRHNLYITAIDERLQDSHLPIVQDSRVGIRGRTANQNVVSPWGLLREGIGLHEPDRQRVDPDEESDVLVSYQTLVTEQRHLRGLCGGDDALGFVCVMRH